MKKPLIRYAIVSLAAACTCASATASLIHHWTFEGNAADSGSGNNPLTLQSNASLVTDCSPLGSGALFVDAATAPTNGGAISSNNVNWGTFANGDTRTIAMWVKLTPGQEANATYFGAGTNSTGTRFDIKENGGFFRVEVQGTGQTTAVSLANNRWRHVAVVVPIATAQFKDVLFYVDGQNVTNASTNTTAINTATEAVRLGDNYILVADDRDTTGYIDDVRIYDNALTPAEIQALYNAGRLCRCFASDDYAIVLGDSASLSWDVAGYSTLDSLVITNDQDATVIDAAALSTDGVGTTTLSPTVTTTYTLTASANGGALGDSRQLTVTVKTAPDVNTFTATPAFSYGTATPTLAWTTADARRIEISDGTSTIATYTTSVDGQAALDAGSLVAPGITATTTYTITAWLNEGATGNSTTLQSTATLQAAPDFTLHASPPFAAAGQPVTLSWNATLIENEAVAGGFEGFDNPLVDSDVDFDSVLQSGTDYFMEVTNGNIAGSTTAVTGWSGNQLSVVDNFASDTSWTTYRVFSTSGTDMIVIHDGSGNIATITDPAQLASGSLTLDPGPNVTTTYTGTASITGSTSNAVDTAAVTIGGPGTSYAERVFNDGPVAYYRFEENSKSSVVYDSSGNGNHSVGIIGTLTSGVAGPLGQCGRFNNNTTVTTPVTLNPQDPDGDDLAGDDDPDDSEGWTLEALAYADDATPAAPSNIMANQDGTGTGRSMMFIRTTGTLTCFTGNTTSPADNLLTTPQVPLGDEDWYHLAITCTGNADGTYTLRFFRDGQMTVEQVLQNTSGLPLAPEAATGNWVIGSHKTRQPGAFWKGLLDECAIYDRALSPAEIGEHFSALLGESVGPLELNGPRRAVAGSSIELIFKTGGASSSASIDNGVGTVPLGTSSTVSVSPTEDTTYVLDVDGQQLSFFVDVIDPFFVTDFGLDNGSGFPFVAADGLTDGISYQLFVSDNLVNWTAAGAKVVGGPTGTATFNDPTAFDAAVRPKRFYEIRDVDP